MVPTPQSQLNAVLTVPQVNQPLIDVNSVNQTMLMQSFVIKGSHVAQLPTLDRSLQPLVSQFVSPKLPASNSGIEVHQQQLPQSHATGAATQPPIPHWSLNSLFGPVYSGLWPPVAGHMYLHHLSISMNVYADFHGVLASSQSQSHFQQVLHNPGVGHYSNYISTLH